MRSVMKKTDAGYELAALTTETARQPEPPAARTVASDEPAAPSGVIGEVRSYQQDFWQRGVLFLDILRERANNMLDHEQAGLPPLLDFPYEMILDARSFDQPANYALLRITTTGDPCFEACADESKPPVIIVDPRAGHGPGIGGFKRDFMPASLPGMSITKAAELLQTQDKIIRGFPEVSLVYGRAGRANSATDPAPVEMFERRAA